ncbi:MAG: 2-oxo acid dehydrogenase subunit E2 [Proteobacteria bacterium]|nr:2-oxo acid dehydrogenase subunit E2 [Pseudomonadota bacterium]
MRLPPTRAATTRDACRRLAFPPERRLVLDSLRLGRHKPMMHGLLELDVTQARALLAAHRERSGEALSFTAFVLACLGRAVVTHPEVHALRDALGRVVIFEEADATAIVEIEVDGRPFPLAHVLRGINRRSVRELHDELRAVKAAGLRLVSARRRLGLRLALSVPGCLRRLVYRALLSFPRLAKRYTGTMLVTAVGRFSGGAGWGFSAPGLHNLSVVIGGIASRPTATSGEPGPRAVLCLTVSANHELVDGAPLARFTRDFARRLEGAEGLTEAIQGDGHAERG